MKPNMKPKVPSLDQLGLPLSIEPPTLVVPVLTPSEQFSLDNPDYVQPTSGERIIDPNERRARQQENIGGGIAAALRGELSSAVQVSKELSPNRRSVDPMFHLDGKTRRDGLSRIEEIRSRMER